MAIFCAARNISNASRGIVPPAFSAKEALWLLVSREARMLTHASEDRVHWLCGGVADLQQGHWAPQMWLRFRC